MSELPNQQGLIDIYSKALELSLIGVTLKVINRTRDLLKGNIVRGEHVLGLCFEHFRADYPRIILLYKGYDKFAGSDGEQQFSVEIVFNEDKRVIALKDAPPLTTEQIDFLQRLVDGEITDEKTQANLDDSNIQQES